MQNVFFSSPLDPIEQSLGYLDRLEINWGELENHKQFECIVDLIPICYKFGILTQESYDRICKAKDINSIATIIDTLFCSDLITFDNAHDYLDSTLSLKEPQAVADAVKLLGSINLLTDKIFRDIIKHPNHQNIFESIELLNSEDDLTFDRLHSILCEEESDGSDQFAVIEFGSMNTCRLL